MASAVFPDNTVLINFACIDELGLLEGWLRGRGRWTAAVHFEATRSASYYPPLNAAIAGSWLGEPIEVPDEGQVDRIRRNVFGGTAAEPLRHLGEAETCHLLMTDSQWHEAWWVSDDRDALEYARRQSILTRETRDIVAELVADGDLSAISGFDLLRRMAAEGRGLRLPSGPGDLLS